MTQLALNAKQFDIIKKILFFANYERNPNMFNYRESLVLTKVAKSRVKTLKQMHDNIVKMQKKSSIYQNKKKKNAFLIKKGNKIFL